MEESITVRKNAGKKEMLITGISFKKEIGLSVGHNVEKLF
jgi:hypothetical protein